MKYTCPYCGKKTYSFLAKMFAGNMTAHGKACPECGRHSVHGLDSTIFSSALMLGVLVYMIIGLTSAKFDFLFCACLFAGAYFISRLADGLFFRLAKNNRNDVS